MFGSRQVPVLFVLAAALLAVTGAGPAWAGSWLDDARYDWMRVPPPAERPLPPATGSLNVDSHAYAREHGFEVRETPRRAFLSSRGDLFDYRPDVRIYIPPTTGTSDAGHGRVSIAPAAVFLQPNYSMYGNYSRRFGRSPWTSPLRPTDSFLNGATPRILHFETRSR